MVYFWLIVIIFLTFIEAMTINLTTVWYVVSAIVTMFLSIFYDNFLVQLGLFTILGTVLLLFTRPILMKFMKKSHELTNIDRVIGMDALVTSSISKNSFGEVKVDGKLWTAVANKRIDKGTIVKVLKIDGVKLVVDKKGDD